MPLCLPPHRLPPSPYPLFAEPQQPQPPRGSRAPSHQRFLLLLSRWLSATFLAPPPCAREKRRRQDGPTPLLPFKTLNPPLSLHRWGDFQPAAAKLNVSLKQANPPFLPSFFETPERKRGSKVPASTSVFGDGCVEKATRFCQGHPCI